MLECRSASRIMGDAPKLKGFIKAVVQIVIKHKEFPLMWTLMDILCRDSTVAATASKEVVTQIQRGVLTPWQLLWCLSKMAQKVSINILWQSPESNVLCCRLVFHSVYAH